MLGQFKIPLSNVLISASLSVGVALSACATTDNTAGFDVGQKAQSDELLGPNDPNVTCKPSYTQVYQPPLKLGGAGRVIQIPDGQECKLDPAKRTLNADRNPKDNLR